MSINRIYFNKLYGELCHPEVSILLGARQVGKSTLMRQLEEAAQKNGLSTVFYDLEQSADLQELNGDIKGITHRLTTSSQVIFIDEFHYLTNASKIFKAVFDSRRGQTFDPANRQGVKIYASGSSSLEIHKHLKESLAGRFIKTMINPLSIAEWRQIPEFQAGQYLQWGGLPGLSQRPDAEKKVELLDNIVNTYITKDIKGLIKEENIRAFNQLLYLISQSQGSLAVASELARETGLSEVTVARHLEIMAQTYVLHGIFSFSGNMANELKKSRKYYLFDLGIRNALLKDFRSVDEREDRGCLYETAVLIHLITQLKPNMELRFWRTKKGDEVDFIVLKNRVPVPIEVKSKLGGPDDVPKGMIQFLRRYPQAPLGVVYNENITAEVKVEGRPVYFQPWEEAGNFGYMQSVF